MDSTTSSAPAETRRANVYLAAAETAATEAREIDMQVAELEARLVAMRERAGSLAALAKAMRALLPARAEGPAAEPAHYVPVEILDTPPSGLEIRDWKTLATANGSA